jgi:heat-inducible transcriptional repressor
MLDDRKTAILGAVVQEYIATAQPVGSTHISSAPNINVSSATVRNEMAMLESEGYLIQPHTSAGRIPTDKGYRFFVDNLAAPGTLAAHGRLEELLHQTSNLLADLTHSAAVVVGPKAEAAPIRSVQIVTLSSTAATVVVVLANGSVENTTIELTEDDDDIRVAAASAHLAAGLVGAALGSLTEVAPSGDQAIDRICSVALSELAKVGSGDLVYTGGASEVARAFDAVEVVRSVLHTLEQQFVVVSLVSDIVGRGMSVSIGGEHGIEPLAACSVVVAPVVIDGEHLGSVGVLGPTRMNYPQALATVDAVSALLGHRIEEG